MGIPTGAASDPMLRVGRLQDLGDTATDVAMRSDPASRRTSGPS